MQIFVRSFAPFKSFGGGYHGDNRSASTDPMASARVRWVFTFDVATMRQVPTEGDAPTSDPSTGEGFLPSVLSYTTLLTGSAKFQHDNTVGGRGVPKINQAVEGVGRQGRGFSLVGSLSGANPLVAGAADIDVPPRANVT